MCYLVVELAVLDEWLNSKTLEVSPGFTSSMMGLELPLDWHCIVKL